MAYLAKSTVLHAYKLLSNIDSEKQQGLTQKVSALKYASALDLYFKNNGYNCDLKNPLNKDKFASYVGDIVKINNSYCTKDFYLSISPNGRDFDCGSNFYSQSSVKDSKTDPSKTFLYPKRSGWKPVMDIQDQVLIYRYDYLNDCFSFYLGVSELRLAFIIWILRFKQISEDNLNGLRNTLNTVFTSDYCNALYTKDVNNADTSYVEFDKNVCALTDNDINSLFANSSKSLKEETNTMDFNRQQIFYGAPGTGKSFKIKECTKGDDTVIRTTFHPDSDYSTFVGCYKPTMINKEPLYKVGELINKLSEIKASGESYPCHKFAAKYWESLKDLSTSEINNILTTCGFTASMNVEISKGIAVGDYFAKKTDSKKIVYSFVSQSFTKAYIQAWKKLCDTSLWTPPTGIDATPYGRTGKIGGYHDFGYTSDKATLKDSEETALLEVDNFDFPFDGINNFGELHDQITVIVTDLPTEEQNKRYRNSITFTAGQIRELFKNYREKHEKINPNTIPIVLHRIADKLDRKLYYDPEVFDELAKYYGEDITVEVDESNSLLGLYDSATKTVYLFKKNIGNNVDLLRAVYIHEMFHAYYDSGDRYIPKIEEPIVECNTLCFLELFDLGSCNSYLESVRDEQYTVSINYYGFGAHLFENRSLDWMRLYQNAYNQINDTSTIVNEYKKKFSPIYPFGNEEETRDLLYMILKGIKATPSKSFSKEAQFLIIEEINRGNCAQIFGDLFQLLDRGDYGYSEYPIVADDDLKKELENEFTGLKLDTDVENFINSIFKENYPDGITKRILKGELLVLPQNLYIWATMNTSDQSLFPIDSAFKRRWEWKYIPIKNHEDKGYTIDINGVKYDWWGFLARINQVIGETTSSEDKKLGYFFAKAKGKTIDAEQFVGKVLFYIWNDVFKNYGFDNQIFSKGDKKKFEFSDFFKNDGTANDDAVNMFLRKLEETIKIEDLPLEIKEEGVSEVPEK